MPNEGPEHGDVTTIGYTRLAFLADLGARQPRTRFALDRPMPRHVAWEWLVDAVDLWMPALGVSDHPEIRLQVITVYDYKHVGAYTLIPPPHPEGQTNRYRRQLRELLRTAPPSLTGTQMLAHSVRSILTVYPPNDAYTWLVAHQLVPATFKYNDSIGVVPYLLMTPGRVARTPAVITKYWREVDEE